MMRELQLGPLGSNDQELKSWFFFKLTNEASLFYLNGIRKALLKGANSGTNLQATSLLAPEEKKEKKRRDSKSV